MMPSLISSVLMRPSLRMICSMAKVRISRLVQNGMVIRNSQSSRVRSRPRRHEIGGRKAEQQVSDRRHQRQLDRAPEDRSDARRRTTACRRKCRARRKTLTQASVENCHLHVAIGAGRQEGIDQHDQQRPVAASRMMSSAGAKAASGCGCRAVRRSLGEFLLRVAIGQSFRICAASWPNVDADRARPAEARSPRCGCSAGAR